MNNREIKYCVHGYSDGFDGKTNCDLCTANQRIEEAEKLIADLKWALEYYASERYYHGGSYEVNEYNAVVALEEIKEWETKSLKGIK